MRSNADKKLELRLKSLDKENIELRSQANSFKLALNEFTSRYESDKKEIANLRNLNSLQQSIIDRNEKTIEQFKILTECYTQLIRLWV